MRAVKIDPISRMVTEINLKKNPNNTLQELYSIIGCDLVELIQIDEDMVMVVDEEGKCKDVQGAFTFIGWGDGHRRDSHHPRRQWRPFQGSAGEPRIL